MAIKLHGKDYVEVKDRVTAAHAEESYSMLKEETFSLGGREYVRVFIDVKGKQYIGTAECKYNASPKTPDGQSPFECGETSALGRALGFAGYGVVDSIASADEVVSNEQQTSAKGQALHDLGKPGSYEQHEANSNQEPEREAQDISPAIGRMIDSAKKRAEKLGVSWETVKKEARVNFPDTKLVASSFVHINGWITQQEKASAGAGK